MRKTPVIIVGIAIIGAAYLGGIYMSGSRSIDRLHQLVTHGNEMQSKVHLDVQDEHRGLFTSTAKIAATNDQNKIAVNAPLSLHHGLFSTGIEGQVTASVNGENVMKLLHSQDDHFAVTAHVKHNEDGRGSDLHIHVPGKLLLESGYNKQHWTENLDLNISRDSDGCLIISTHEDSSDLISGRTQYAGKDIANRFVYDAQWVDNAIPVIRDNLNAFTEDNKLRLVAIFLSQLPDAHFETKQLTLTNKYFNKSVGFDGASVDLVRENGSIPVSHLSLNIKDANVEGKHYKGDLSLKLDQAVVDTYTSIMSSAALNRQFNEESAEAKVVALLQGSPRLVLEKLDISGDDIKPISVNGFLTVNGSDIKTSSDVNGRMQTLMKGQLVIHNIPELLVNYAMPIVLGDIKAGETVKFDVDNGHVAVNDQRWF